MCIVTVRFITALLCCATCLAVGFVVIGVIVSYLLTHPPRLYKGFGIKGRGGCFFCELGWV